MRTQFDTMSASLQRVVTGALLVLALNGGAAAQQTIPGLDGSVYPATPRAFEQLWVKFICIDLERCAGGTVSMSANTITVVRHTAPCLVCGYPVSAFVELGRLPAGTYTVKIVSPAGGVRSTQQVTVSDPNPPGPFALPTLGFPLGNYTDQWWDPDEPGWGIAITQHVSGGVFAVWAVYGSDNQPVWYTLQPGSWTAYNTFSGPVYRTTGPYLGGRYSDGPPVAERQAGTATLTFTDPVTGTLQFNLDNVSGTKAIRRLDF